MSAVTDYLSQLQRELAAGNATEHTHRPALKALIEALAPGAQAVNEPRRVACGAPDFIVLRGATPLGHVETKDVGVSLDVVERSEQMARYLDGLGNLVLTDYLEFRWYVGGQHRLTACLGALGAGNRLRRESGGAEAVAELLTAFMQAQAPTVSNAQDLAQRMAGLARLVRDTIRATFAAEGGDPLDSPLHAQLASFRETLLHDLSPEQFADMYAQTICYGLFAARVNYPHPSPLPKGEGAGRPASSKKGDWEEHPLPLGEGRGEGGFTRVAAAQSLPKTNPFMRWLFGHIVGHDLDDRLAWAVDDLVDLLGRADMAAILRDFGQRTRQQDPVIHFYETFLHAYDPVVRETRGVYYTPQPVVSYIVRSLDHLLRAEFGCAAGLAESALIARPNTDPALTVKGSAGKASRKTAPCHRVLILDPACGTGTFLQSVIAHIHDTLAAQGQQGAWSSYVSEHLLPRLHGFELLMAPYAVAHLKLGLQLRELGYDFQANERLRVYLTNTLEEPHEWAGLPLFTQELAREVQAANEVKRDLPIMVILGNPPYSGHSANKGQWINNLLRSQGEGAEALPPSYFQVDGQPLGEKNPKWLNDDYVKFIRFAQWRIAQTGYGVLGFITNHSYLDSPTFRGMRQSLMQTFDALYLLDLHGNSKKRERAPDGSPDENVFDIQQGVAVALLVKRGGARRGCVVRRADLWGLREAKYAWLEANDVASTPWQTLLPQAPFYLFAPQNTDLLAEYSRGWKITEAMPVNVLGFQTHRDQFAIDLDEQALRRRFAEMRANDLSDEAFAARYGLESQMQWLVKARKQIRQQEDWQRPILTCLYRPFDWRPCYYSDIVMDRPRRELLDHVAGKKNLCLLSSRQQATVGYQHCWVAKDPANDCVVSTKSREANQVFPLYLYPTTGELPGIDAGAGRRANFAPAFLAALGAKLGLRAAASPLPVGEGQGEGELSPEDVFHYIYAVLHSPAYRARYAEFLKTDFPRVPLTGDAELFGALAALGRELAALHLLESPALARLVTRFPVAGDNRVQQVRYAEPQGGQAGRVYINATQYFEGVPPEVWAFMVGGYQVCEKWLKDRKGRQLSFDDLLHYQRVVTALSETMRLMAEIDEVIEEHGGWPLQ